MPIAALADDPSCRDLSRTSDLQMHASAVLDGAAALDVDARRSAEVFGGLSGRFVRGRLAG